ncbi:MAG: hypothetical protein QOK30_3220, partial [Nocardioidaceae bacterium]|nr:hypothetical protein [Nocardioidaceae bacterium]
MNIVLTMCDERILGCLAFVAASPVPGHDDPAQGLSPRMPQAQWVNDVHLAGPGTVRDGPPR